MIPKQTELDPKDTLIAILSPLAQALDDHNLTLDRLCEDLDTVIKTTADEPGHKLKGIDMAIKLNQAYPAEQHDLTVSPGGVADALMARIAANVKALPALPDTRALPAFAPSGPTPPGARPSGDYGNSALSQVSPKLVPVLSTPAKPVLSPDSAGTQYNKGAEGVTHGREGAGV